MVMIRHEHIRVYLQRELLCHTAENFQKSLVISCIIKYLSFLIAA